MTGSERQPSPETPAPPPTPARPGRQARRHLARAALRSPPRLRDIVVLQEILAPPVSLRRHEGPTGL